MCLLKCFSFDRQTLCLVAENHSSRQSGSFLQLEQFLFASLPNSNIEICSNDLHDILHFLHPRVKKEDFDRKQEKTIVNIKNVDSEDENNNINKESSQQDTAP